MNSARYIVTHPLPEGTCWYVVADTQSEIMPNFGVADFSESMPNAEAEAIGLCERLNRGVK